MGTLNVHELFLMLQCNRTKNYESTFFIINIDWFFVWNRVWLYMTENDKKKGIDLSIDKSIKTGKSDLIDIDCIDQSVEIDDTLVSFIDLSRFYRFHRFISEDTSVLLFIQKWKLISWKQWICWQLSCNWESRDQTIYYHFF